MYGTNYADSQNICASKSAHIFYLKISNDLTTLKTFFSMHGLGK
jgi:hypothetical protein